MLRQPENLHPEVFVEVWRKWSFLCASYEATNGSIGKPVERRLWSTALKIVDCNIRLEWQGFCHKYGLGVYK